MKNNDSIRNVKRLRYVDFVTTHDKYCSPYLGIPGFQRNFVWPNKKIKAFIESIIENKDAFYIGNFLIQEGGRSGQPNLVVDGQQRIVTISLALTAVLSDLETKDSVKKYAHDMLFLNNKKPRLFFERTGVNRVYGYILKNNLNFKTGDVFLKNFLTKYKYIKKLVKELNSNELVEKIKDLQLVVINCSSTHDVITLYQGLNSTSKKLEPAELIKSLIVGDNTKKSGLNLWKKLENSFFERNPIWLDKFFRQHWFSINGYISGDHLYSEIKKKLKNDPLYLKEVATLSPIYLDIRDGNLKLNLYPWNKMGKDSRRELNYIFETIKSLRLDQVYAPILSLVKYGIKNGYYLTNSLFFDDIYRIYCFLILFKFSEINPNKVERLFASFCRDISQENLSKKKFEDIKNTFFKNLKIQIPKQDEFAENLISSIKYSKKEEVGDSHLVKSLLGLVLLEENSVIPPNCEIEHIFPEGGKYSSWKISKEAENQLVNNKLRITLGNLTLLKPKDNRLADAKNFDYKNKEFYSVDRNFIGNRKLINYGFETPSVHIAVNKRAKNDAVDIYNKLSLKLYDGK